METQIAPRISPAAPIRASALVSPHATPAALERLAALAVTAGEAHEWIDVHAPYTGEVLGRIPRGTERDVAEAVHRARLAQADWATRTSAERARVLLRFHDLLLDRRDEVLDLVQLESGKTRLNAFEEVVDTANVARYYATRGPGFLKPKRRRGMIPGLTLAREYRHPIGVVGFIVPWNYPLNLAVTDAMPALMAGNTAVLKPDHHTPFTALWAAALLYEAGLPRDAMPVVTGDGAQIGPALVDRVDFVMFTGSTRTGRVVGRQAAGRLVGCSLELGGKNPMIVTADAPLGKAVEGAVRGAFVGAGQVCVSIERLYVARRIHDEFLDRLAVATRALRLGATLDYESDVGSLGFAAQLERVAAHVDDARAKGARVVTGGRARPEIGPYFYEPTILDGVTPDMRCFAEETFGPVVSVMPFGDVDEAIELANASHYGLNASVWTADAREGVRIATRLEAGSVNVNEAYNAAWGSVDAPIGGFKQSGLGRRHGRDGLLKYTEAQTVAVQRGIALAPMTGMSRSLFTRAVSGMLRTLRRAPGLR